MSRIVCWFSCGAASAVATKLAIEMNEASETPRELVIASIYIKDEHPDSERFLRDCERWFGRPILRLQCDKYSASVDEVVRKTRFLRGPSGARCTKELKKLVRLGWQEPDDTHVFGMTKDEEGRINRLIDQEPELDVWPVLVEQQVTKQMCFQRLLEAGIALPKMYRLGYNNNNCIGCLKATGAGYWNKIRADFPDVFAVRAEQERLLNMALVDMSANKFINEFPEAFVKMLDAFRAGETSIKISSQGKLKIPLRFLPPTAGKHESIDVGDCGFFCEPQGSTAHG